MTVSHGLCALVLLVIPASISATQNDSTNLTDDSELPEQRPFYIIGHMANSVKTMDTFIAEGANAVEADVTFENNGAAWYIYHGLPCDYLRVCHESAVFVEYLRAAATRDLALIFLDLKGSKLGASAKEFAGVDIARKLSGHFWDKGGEKINVVLSVPYVTDLPIIESLVKELRTINETYLDKLSYEVSENPPFHVVSKRFKEINITSIWQGDGITNWFEPFRGYGRVESAIALRDKPGQPFKKVYRWTVDITSRMRELIFMGVDGIMTNHPWRVKQVLKSMREIRLARSDDGINDAFSLWGGSRETQ